MREVSSLYIQWKHIKPWLSSLIADIFIYQLIISILKISKLLQIRGHRGIDITSFEKHLESSLESYSELMSEFGDMSFKDYVSKWISHTVFYRDLVNKLRRIKDTLNFISSGSKIVKRLRWRQNDPFIIEMTMGLVLGLLHPCTDLSWSIVLWLSRLWGLMTGLV